MVETWLLKVKQKMSEIERAFGGHSGPPMCPAKYFAYCFDRE